ncbi:hypothetical protein [Terriglobus roseus]|uniref:DUF4412 domain-containing protein n=1 Tax=Terriglobus roseus TaxID=392734 RepID=A0A1H4SNL1_9BACT|nr:hypothetical protein [Terriglobus roseus]SEC45845.1 hypothetical protein SAMN05443244_3509 [Terriglobus roseus]
MKIGLVSAALLLAVVPVFAQGPGGPGGGPGFMGRGFGPMEGGFGMMRQPVTNAPYSATFTSTSTEKLQDGTVLTHTTTRVATRDALGRTREEVTLPARPDGDGKPHTMVVIMDPIAHTITRLQAEKKIAIVHQIPEPRPHDGPGRRGPGGPPQDASAPPPPDGGQGPRGRHEDRNVVTADLGSKTIDGVVATGKRVTRTIPVSGTDKPVVATHEDWFSPDLKIELSRSDVDPFRGTHTTVVSGLSKAAPDATLFQIPQGYTVEQAPQHAGRRGPGRDGQAPPPPPSGM